MSTSPRRAKDAQRNQAAQAANVSVLDQREIHEVPKKLTEDEKKALDEAFVYRSGIREGQSTRPGDMCALNLVHLPPIPFQMTLWRIAVLVPRPPEKSAGGIVHAQAAVDTENALSNVGILVSMGVLAYKTQTRAGVDLNDEPFNPALGDYVIFPQHAGVILGVRLKDQPDLMFRMMADSDVLAVTKTPQAFRHYL